MNTSRTLFLRPKVTNDSSGSSDDFGPSPHPDDVKFPKTQSRKNHTKSRRGCHNCKRRRIKCPEDQPICLNCAKRGLKCEWPELQIHQSGLEEIASSLTSIRSLQPSNPGPNFSMQDFRLFYHFIAEAYPHHPLGNEGLWKTTIPCIAADHDFLMHGMLALAASELFEDSPNESALACTALRHRLSAIKALRVAMSSTPTLEAANAMLATCYTLIHQSALLEDGIIEFMAFTRGCVQVLFHMGINSIPLLFKNVIADAQLDTMGPHFEGEPCVDVENIDEAITDLKAIEHLCVTDGEKKIHGYILECANGLKTSKRLAYIGLMHIYGCFCYEMSQSDFDIFVSPTNEIGKLLQTFWVGVQNLLDPITIHEQDSRKDKVAVRNNESLRWMKPLLSNINPAMMEYYRWPIMHTHRVWESERAE